MTALPRYAELPVDSTKPRGSAWGVFGVDDQLGTINLLGPAEIVRAAQLVSKGAVFSLNWNIELPNPPLVGRKLLRPTLEKGVVGTEDYYDRFYTHGSTQWDALSHIAEPGVGFYNGCSMDEITGKRGSRNGIDQWARKGIVGRFVLADVAALLSDKGTPIAQDQRVEISVETIEEALEVEGATLQSGDILLVRLGWIEWYENAPQKVRRQMARPPYDFPAPGLSPSERTAQWLWDNHVAAVATDTPALEAYPVRPEAIDGFLHRRLVALLGMAIGEMFQLRELAVDCRRDGRYNGLFTSAPLNKVGGSGSPANALAIK